MSEYSDSLIDVFLPLGDVRTRRMFGGYGLFLDDLMFGLVSDDLLYLKVDERSRQDFIELGLEPFCYPRQGKRVALSFYQAPEDIFDDQDAAVSWGQKALAAALRSRTKR